MLYWSHFPINVLVLDESLNWQTDRETDEQTASQPGVTFSIRLTHFKFLQHCGGTTHEPAHLSLSTELK